MPVLCVFFLVLFLFFVFFFCFYYICLFIFFVWKLEIEILKKNWLAGNVNAGKIK